MKGLKRVFERLFEEIQEKIDERVDEDVENFIFDREAHEDYDQSLGERAEIHALWMIRKNPFLKLLRRTGKDKSEEISFLTITWGRDETI